MSIERTLQVIQVTYPQVYLACHTRHQRKRTTAHRLSARDSSILAHLDESRPATPIKLAAHLGISRSTLSEAVKRLAQLGYVVQVARRAANGQRGGRGILLTPLGVAAMEATSVLESARLRGVLAPLTAADRRAVERGMSILASACLDWSASQPADLERDP